MQWGHVSLVPMVKAKIKEKILAEDNKLRAKKDKLRAKVLSPTHGVEAAEEEAGHSKSPSAAGAGDAKDAGSPSPSSAAAAGAASPADKDANGTPKRLKGRTTSTDKAAPSTPGS